MEMLRFHILANFRRTYLIAQVFEFIGKRELVLAAVEHEQWFDIYDAGQATKCIRLSRGAIGVIARPHCLEGPALWADPNDPINAGSYTYRHYYIDGCLIDREAFDTHPRVIEHRMHAALRELAHEE